MLKSLLPKERMHRAFREQELRCGAYKTKADVKPDAKAPTIPDPVVHAWEVLNAVQGFRSIQESDDRTSMPASHFEDLREPVVGGCHEKEEEVLVP
jgi:hypothetical protein